MIDADAPFVLLDDLRDGGGPARLFRAPVETIVAHRLDEVAPALERLRSTVGGGRHAAGFLSYEAGYALEARLTRLHRRNATPLLWFGLFETAEPIDREHVASLLPDPRGAWAGVPVPRIDAAAYRAAFDRVAEYIAAGDIYQANLSFRADVPFAGHPLALYARLRGAGAGGWGGVVFTGNDWLLSTSPELFFRLDESTLVARPMKGTTARGATPGQDTARIAALLADPKERAENLMIVDLLRNDLSRIAEAGSVAVPALFEVETYPTLHTLTSTITARLRQDRSAIDALAATFPCGSVTGAPKIRAMEVIAEVEPDTRGPYTGSMGWLSPDGDAGFNVLIRTLAIRDGRATLGIGSGIVADSTADAEWHECLAKAAFVTRDTPAFELIETMAFDPGTGIRHRAGHMARLVRSAATFGFDVVAVEAAIDAAVAQLDASRRLRLTLGRDGAVSVAIDPLPTPLAEAVVALAPLPVDAQDFRLRHKTTDRDFYDDARRAAAVDEVVFVDRDGFLTEGSFTNIFVQHGDVLLTPSTARGLLPGVLRADLLASGRAVEADIRPADLSAGFLVGNALRGLIPARLAATPRTPTPAA